MLTIPISPTYFACSAYRANYLYNARCDYRKALDLCMEVKKILTCSSVQHVSLLFADFLPFPLRSEWCGLYDNYIQIVFGFLTLQRTLTASSTARNRMISVYICPIQCVKYIYTRCCRNLQEPVTGFGLGSERLCQYMPKHCILRYRVGMSHTILLKLLYKLVNQV